MIIHNCEQGTEEWFALRCGKPTASCFALATSKGRGSAPSKTRQSYLYTLAGERVTGEVAESYSNAHMERGKEMEPQAIAGYEFITGNTVARVGFIESGDLGASPDGLVGEDGGIEVKTMLPKILAHWLLTDEVPPEHTKQLQGLLLVSQRRWVDFVGFWPNMPMLVKHVERDEKVIAELKIGLAQFIADLEAVTAKLEAMK